MVFVGINRVIDENDVVFAVVVVVKDTALPSLVGASKFTASFDLPFCIVVVVAAAFFLNSFPPCTRVFLASCFLFKYIHFVVIFSYLFLLLFD